MVGGGVRAEPTPPAQGPSPGPTPPGTGDPGLAWAQDKSLSDLGELDWTAMTAESK